MTDKKDQPKKRSCRYCRAMFVPRPQDINRADFCSPEHKVLYWRHGTKREFELTTALVEELRYQAQRELSEAEQKAIEKRKARDKKESTQ